MVFVVAGTSQDHQFSHHRREGLLPRLGLRRTQRSRRMERLALAGGRQHPPAARHPGPTRHPGHLLRHGLSCGAAAASGAGTRRRRTRDRLTATATCTAASTPWGRTASGKIPARPTSQRTSPAGTYTPTGRSPFSLCHPRKKHDKISVTYSAVPGTENTCRRRRLRPPLPVLIHEEHAAPNQRAGATARCALPPSPGNQPGTAADAGCVLEIPLPALQHLDKTEARLHRLLAALHFAPLGAR